MRDAWSARSEKLEERKLSNIYPATKVRKITSWRDTKAESCSGEQAAPIAANTGVWKHQGRHTQPEEQHLKARPPAGASLKLPLQECNTKKTRNRALVTSKVSGNSEAWRQEPVSLCKRGKKGPPSPQHLKPQAPSASGSGRMGEAFGSQFQADEVVEQATAKARKCTNSMMAKL